MGRGRRVTLKRRPQRLPRWFKFLLGFTALASASLLVNAVVGRDGLLELQRQQERYQTLRQKVLEEKDQLDRLEAQVRGLEDRPGQERIAREDLDLVGEGEIVYRFHPGEPAPPSAPEPSVPPVD